jgi:hypothetical protein
MLALDLGVHLGVRARKVVELDEVVSPFGEVAPGRDLGAQRVGVAEDPLGGPGVVPEVGARRLLVQVPELAFLGG